MRTSKVPETAGNRLGGIVSTLASRAASLRILASRKQAVDPQRRLVLVSCSEDEPSK